MDSRAAFPSLHAAVSLVALVYAWRYARWLVLGAPAVRAGALGLDDLPAPPLRGGPAGGLGAGAGGRGARAAARRVVGAPAGRARLRARPRGGGPPPRARGLVRPELPGWTRRAIRVLVAPRPGLKDRPGLAQVGARPDRRRGPPAPTPFARGHGRARTTSRWPRCSSW